MIPSPQLLSGIIADFINKPREPDPMPKACALEIVFLDPVMASEFQSLIAPVIPAFQNYGCRLIAFYPLEDVADLQSAKIFEILSSFDAALIKQDFKSDWLAEYFTLCQYGIYNFGAHPSLSSTDQIQCYIAEREQIQLKNKTYDARLASAREAVLDYSNAQMIEDIAQFLSANWEGFKDNAHVHDFVAGLIFIMESETRDSYHFSGSPAQQIIYAMTDKADFLAKKEANGDPDKLSNNVEKKSAVLKELNRLASQNKPQQRLSHCTKSLARYINDVEPSLVLKGFLPLLRDASAKVEAFVPFKGVDLSFDYMEGLNYRLSPQVMRFSIQEDAGGQQLNLLAEAIADYYLKIMQLKHEAKFESLLVAHSKIMDKAPFYDNLLRIAAESRPDHQSALQNNEDASEGMTF